MNDNNKSFYTKVFKQFDKKVMVNVLNKKSEKIPMPKPIDFSNISPLLVLLRLFKKELNKSKYHGKNQKMPNNIPKNHTYAQASFRNIEDIHKIKDSFSNLLNKKIENIHKSINNTGKMKSHINIIIKDLSCKQIIAPMGSNNIHKIIVLLGKYVTNLNCTLKSIKLDDIIDFICFDYKGQIITANKITLPSDLSTVERYFKNTEFLDSNNIQHACLSQSKSYLKILGKLYNIEGTNISISLSVVETIIKTTYIFDNIHIISKLCMIKVLSKSDIAIFGLISGIHKALCLLKL